MALVLLVEDENLLRWGLRRQLELSGHVVHEAATLGDAEGHLKEHRPDVVVLDLRLPDGDGLEFMAAQRAAPAESAVVVVTASGQVAAAVAAMKLGAFDFLSKPLRDGELAAVVGHAIEKARERNIAETARREQERIRHVDLVAESQAMQGVLKLADAVAASTATTVLLQGETGTGKEVVARHIHAVSPRADGPLLALNCAALPENLVESELFGHEKGAFTDAKAVRKGIFELAHGGTVILDEIGELPPSTQAKLLRFLEERFLRRVGGMREIHVDVRILALTNRDLEQRVKLGEFRSDLFFRLNVFPITIPPLRERRQDILPLARLFVRRFGALGGKVFKDISSELTARLLAYDWPGNVRELRNAMERSSILEPGGIVTGTHLPVGLTGVEPQPAGPDLGDGIVALDEIEFIMVQRAMGASGGNQSEAARLLGVTRDQVRYRLKRYRGDGRWPQELETRDDDEGAGA